MDLIDPRYHSLGCDLSSTVYISVSVHFRFCTLVRTTSLHFSVFWNLLPAGKEAPTEDFGCDATATHEDSW
jgi:hypothetical protein